jgi:apolipoprotein D and lipocalin family protein
MGFCFPAPLRHVSEVDVNRFLGVWKVIAVIPTPFEVGACNPTERYTWDGKRQRIDVDFTFNAGTVDGPVKSVPQHLYTGKYPVAGGKWSASPMWPIKLDYTIMDLAPDYSWVVVGHHSRKWWWLMAKEQTTLPKDVVDKALALGNECGFDMSQVVYPPHRSVKG